RALARALARAPVADDPVEAGLRALERVAIAAARDDRDDWRLAIDEARSATRALDSELSPWLSAKLDAAIAASPWS
ncbi:MAG: hypothetical protein K1X88_35600, partial [Nannocystaceae bacterium]|nr:hypothetical protein [Nannocystaceae bacterium]